MPRLSCPFCENVVQTFTTNQNFVEFPHGGIPLKINCLFTTFWWIQSSSLNTKLSTRFQSMFRISVDGLMEIPFCYSIISQYFDFWQMPCLIALTILLWQIKPGLSHHDKFLFVSSDLLVTISLVDLFILCGLEVLWPQQNPALSWQITLQEHQKFRNDALISITFDTIYNYFRSTIFDISVEVLACVICVFNVTTHCLHQFYVSANW